MPRRVIVLGLDGIDPQTVDLLLSENKLLNFAKLRREGAYGRLRSQPPLLSPVVWTTIATGKTPEHHGIGHFVTLDQVTGEQVPVTSEMRRVKALWNILSEANKSVASVGWWATWPPEQVRGAMVSDHLSYHFLLNDPRATNTSAADAVFPSSLTPKLMPCVTRPDQLTMAAVAPFVRVTEAELARPFDFQDDLSHFKWALAAASTHRCVGLQLWKDEQPSTLMVYFEGVDSASHLFGHLFRAGSLAGELQEQHTRYGQAVEAMYVYIDRVVGDYLAVMGRDTTLMVLSDHGFELGALNQDPSKTRDMRRVSEIYHRIEGILYLYGAGIRPRTRIENATILDIAPTLLALQGLPAAQDMTGRVLVDALALEPPTRVASYESAGPPNALAPGASGASPGDPAPPAADAQANRDAIQRLQSLGYIGTSSPKSDRTLAAMQLEAGRYAEAANAFERLVKANPGDAPLRASLAGALGALGRFDEAEEQLSIAIRLQPLNVEAYHNRAAIYERKGSVAAAIADYQTAMRYNPQYEPSRRALERLGVTAGPAAPRTDAEQRALRVADEASNLARHGNYTDAMKKLDEAAGIAPRYALIYQYRSNVAYLMGDTATAIAALKRGLELEPDNALFRENLKRLQGR